MSLGAPSRIMIRIMTKMLHQVAFGFLPLNFCRWRGPTNYHLLKKECSFSGSDNVRLWGRSNTTRWKTFFEHYRSSGNGDTKTFWSSIANVNVPYDPPGETLTKQECFPVGCVPPALVVISGDCVCLGGVCLGSVPRWVPA